MARSQTPPVPYQDSNEQFVEWHHCLFFFLVNFRLNIEKMEKGQGDGKTLLNWRSFQFRVESIFFPFLFWISIPRCVGRQGDPLALHKLDLVFRSLTRHLFLILPGDGIDFHFTMNGSMTLNVWKIEAQRGVWVRWGVAK